MAYFRRNLNLDPAQFRRAEKQAEARGVSVNQFVRDAIERHNDAVDASAQLEAAGQRIEQLVDEVRLEHVQLRHDLTRDVEQWRAALQADHDQAVDRYEQALKRVLHAFTESPRPQPPASRVPAPGQPMTAPRL